MPFHFGKNCREFSQAALCAERVAQAQAGFEVLTEGLPLEGRAFLDIGFGQGLGLLIARKHGARVVGCDINATCREALEQSATFFDGDPTSGIPVTIGSILDYETVSALEEASPNGDGRYDIVHSWGVLHHTGDMRRALDHASQLVGAHGYFVIAIYNRHWTSPLWRCIKWFYCVSPTFLQKTMIALFFPVIWMAKLLVTGKNPTRKSRGMSFFFDVIDWVGGYPYEYGSIAEISALVEGLGFRAVRAKEAGVPTGCNEIIFQRLS